MDMLKQQRFDAVVEDDATSHSAPDHAANAKKASRAKLIKQIALPLIILAAGVGVVALISLLQQPPEKKENTVTAPGVNTVMIAPQAITFSITSQGTVAPRTETPLVTEVSGVVITVSPKLQAGGFFQEGEVLLTLDDSDYQAGVKQAQANLLGKKAQLTQEIAQSEQAEKEWRLTGRAKSEAPILALRQPFLDKAKAEVQYAEAELSRAERKLERTKIRAPYDGLIKSKNIGLGQYVTVGTNLADIIAVDYAEVRLPLSDDEIAFLNLPAPQNAMQVDGSENSSAPAVVLTATVGGKQHQWPARIVRTEGIIDSRSRVHYAVAQIVDPYGLHNSIDDTQKPALSVGSFVKAQIEGITVSDVFSVPRNAFRDENTIMVLDKDMRLRLRETEVVRSDNEYGYVTSGIEPGEEVITTALTAPVDGMQLRKFGSE